MRLRVLRGTLSQALAASGLGGLAQRNAAHTDPTPTYDPETKKGPHLAAQPLSTERHSRYWLAAALKHNAAYEAGCLSASASQRSTSNRRHSPGMPLSVWTPRSWND